MSQAPTTKHAEEPFAELRRLVDECLPRRADGSPDTEREKSDVVHDLLAFLAERMMAMNREKQGEVKGFLTWLERQIGANVDDLSKKTKVRDYHEHDLDTLLGVLRSNRRKLTANPNARAFQQELEREFTRSVDKLGPLKQRIAATDRLIDQIVYRLYGLTADEIAIIESGT
ncbi:MAG: hypothetical protein FJ290_26810 [Planctomycetes bacterium]|nr:hypothetical protein [Planctomycetota bacterium]